MNWTLGVLVLITAAFAALTGYSLQAVGYLGIWKAGLSGPGAYQILADLIITCGLAMTWMLHDARSRKTMVWPYLLITLASGAFGPLFYLLHRSWSSRRSGQSAPRYG